MRYFAILLAAFAAPALADNACTGWVQVSSPNIGVNDNVLASVAANSASDIWAVGLLAPDSNPNITNTLVNHYDGTSWSVVTSPNVGNKANALLSVTANSGLSWAVGYYLDATRQTRSLIEAWNGSTWNIIDHPHPGTKDLLFGVSALSPTNIWAVGVQRTDNGPFQTLIEHFDGSFWSIVPSPSPGSTGNWLYSVQAISAKSVWAVGQKFGDAEPDQALIEHWNGSEWSVVPSPPDSSSTLLYSVAGVSDAILWAAGDAESDAASPTTLLERLTSAGWLLASGLNIPPGENHFYGIAAAPNNLVWAVGAYAPTVNGNLNTLIAHLEGTQWVQETSPNPGQKYGNSELGGVVIISPGEVWAVGAYDGANASRSLILHRCP